MIRLITTAASDGGKGEDTFGVRDDDWQLYKLRSKHNDDGEDEPNPDEAELTQISSSLQVSLLSTCIGFCHLFEYPSQFILCFSQLFFDMGII